MFVLERTLNKNMHDRLELIFFASLLEIKQNNQKLRVCEVCSAYLGIHDNDRRLADQSGGRLHLGFIEIREVCPTVRVESNLCS